MNELDDYDDLGAWDDDAVADGCAIAWDEFRAARLVVAGAQMGAAA